MLLRVVVLLALVPVLAGFLAVPRVARRMPPASASVLLTVFSLTVSSMTGLMLCLAALFGVIRLLPALRPHDWSAHTLYDQVPIPAAVGVAAGVLAVVLLARAGVHLVRVARSMRRTAAAVAGLPVVNGLAIVDDPALYAYAVPGRRRLVVVSTGVLWQLSGPQRRALLAHEDAHLRHHHHLYVQLSRLAAAANPLMRPVARAVASSLERWADADAIRDVGDPAIVAHALGKVALASNATLPAQALGAARSDVVERVRDLLEPPTRRRRGGLALALGTMLCWASSAAVLLYVRNAVEIAEVVRH
ncbi:MAG TPA: M56 family metallopeptidase [Acidimicrobiales bacterium]|nr:M56 family metallopeptidase [Acidimicrobiales bacterium]